MIYHLNFIVWYLIILEEKKPIPIDSLEKLKIKMEMLEALSDLEVASKLLSNSKKEIDVHPYDSAYNELHTKLTPLDKNNEKYKIICDYVKNTHGETHKMEVKVIDIFEVEREGEKKTIFFRI